MIKKSIRIGAGLGFYGDTWKPVPASIEPGGVQYLSRDPPALLKWVILHQDFCLQMPGDMPCVLHVG
ncbi:MAG: hypothetical protein V4711_11760 [Pseudomonadota bacterium]